MVAVKKIFANLAPALPLSNDGAAVECSRQIQLAILCFYSWKEAEGKEWTMEDSATLWL